MNVTVVTVTYGKRAHLLTQVLDAAREQGAAKAVVVDNASADPVLDILTRRYGDWAELRSIGRNSGPAAGFAEGISHAIASRAELILLLDDDNKLAPGALHALVDRYKRHSEQLSADALAVCGARDRFDYYERYDRQKINRLRLTSPFCGFSVFDVPEKLMLRLKQKPPITAPDDASLEFTVYGGLMFHVLLIKRIGLPNRNFYLYQDDVEFTAKITEAGGYIFLVRDAVITELDLDVNSMAHKFANSFVKYIDADSDFRVYYQFRNVSYRSTRAKRANKIVLAINIVAYLVILCSIGVMSMRFKRLGLLLRAFYDGITGRLGEVGSQTTAKI